jgi:hypothetical protein
MAAAFASSTSERFATEPRAEPFAQFRPRDVGRVLENLEQPSIANACSPVL